LGAGCLVDQLVGQFMAHVCGLGYLADPAHIRRALESIRRYNHRDGLTDHFNNMRSFALGTEKALLMASFPKDRPQFPFPYFPEAMTGFEYTAAVGMIYEGQTEAGLESIRDIRERYDGRRRSPFDEAECGHHYARAMASWAAVLALTGFHYSAVDQRMTFAARPGRFFWSTGYGYGTCVLEGEGLRSRCSR
jgi:non-lysosomal glucosylceramidase